LSTIDENRDVGVSTHARSTDADRLTGFGNRERFLADLAVVLEPAVVALFFLDGFHAYRDFFGRLSSDTIVVELADRLERIVRSAGTCYRAREDEFALVLGETGADAVIEASRAVLTEPGRYVSITPAVGIARLPEETSDAFDALRLADHRVSLSNPLRPPRERRRSPR
jgi:GGDEF domain-containing protein